MYNSNLCSMSGWHDFYVLTSMNHPAHSHSSYTGWPGSLSSKYNPNLLSSATQARKVTSHIQGCCYTEIMFMLFFLGICALLATGDAVYILKLKQYALVNSFKVDCYIFRLCVFKFDPFRPTESDKIKVFSTSQQECYFWQFCSVKRALRTQH